MTEPRYSTVLKPVPTIERIQGALSQSDLNDLCDATDAAVEAGGGFGWIRVPARETIERYWQGIIAMPTRHLFVGRLDGVICGTAILIIPPKNNEAQSFATQLTSLFVAPWARGQGVSRMLLNEIEKTARKEGFFVINLDVRETQETAITLYESAGYILIGTHPCYARIDGQIVKGRYYYKPLMPSLNVVPPKTV
ncbi:MAG: GNAT family N-acetyltransferase [Pseudomonadota bacterium]